MRNTVFKTMLEQGLCPDFAERIEMKMNQTTFCQSCAMPLNPEVLGTNADGSKNEDYCTYCYQNGAFASECTMQ